MMKFIFGMFFLCLTVSSVQAGWKEECEAVYDGYNYHYIGQKETMLKLCKKRGIEAIKNCINAFGDKTECNEDGELEFVKRHGAKVIKNCVNELGHRNYCNEDKELEFFKQPGAVDRIRKCELFKGKKCYDSAPWELMSFDDINMNTIKDCKKIYRGNCYFGYLKLIQEFGAAAIKSCIDGHSAGQSSFCQEERYIKPFARLEDMKKKYSTALVERCVAFHGKDFKKCDEKSELENFIKFIPYIDACTYITDDCSQCASQADVEKFTKLDYSQEFKALDYFKIKDLFDLVVQPSCNVFELELRPEYDKYTKKIDSDAKNLVTCEIQQNKSSLMMKKMSALVDSLLGDIKYKSLYLGSRTNEKVQEVFIEIVKEHVAKSELKNKVMVNNDGLSYTDDQERITLSFRDSIDAEGNKSNVLSFKSLSCETKYPPVQKLSYEDFRNHKIPAGCIVASLSESKLKNIQSGNKLKDKSSGSTEGKGSKETKF